MSLDSLPRIPSYDGYEISALDGLADNGLEGARYAEATASDDAASTDKLLDTLHALGQRSLAERAVYRLFDIVIAFMALVLFLPLITMLIVAMRVSSPGPVLFSQRRVGRHGSMFPCLKFRTMLVDSDRVLKELLDTVPAARAEWERDFKLRDDPRITPIGKILRKLSLDELPQLLNVLAGHMSIVGPRPIVPAEIERYGVFFPDYCSVRPGLTGLWQVSGRNDVSYAERVQMDVLYARTKSLLFDVSIIARTVPAVVGARGSY
jgi:lipopolysaccharide/colanic/teichoic acid biosynthesis glycosyltransferase